MNLILGGLSTSTWSQSLDFKETVTTAVCWSQESKILTQDPYKAAVEKRTQWKVTVGRGKKIQKTPIGISGTIYNEAEKREPHPWRSSS